MPVGTASFLLLRGRPRNLRATSDRGCADGRIKLTPHYAKQ